MYALTKTNNQTSVQRKCIGVFAVLYWHSYHLSLMKTNSATGTAQWANRNSES